MKANFDEKVKEFEGIGKQLPFAIALTLTKVAQDGQEAGRKEEGQVFTNRNDWTVRNTKVTPATKQTLTSEVYTDTGNRSTGAPDYLVSQEDGRERIPIQGRQHIAIPTKFLRQLAGGPSAIIPAWLRPRALLDIATKQNGGKYIQTRDGKFKGQLVRPRSPAVREMFFFLVTFKSGARGILARHVNDPRDQVYPMYVFVTQAHIRKRFHLQDDVDAAVNEHLQRRWDEVVQQIFPLTLG